MSKLADNNELLLILVLTKRLVALEKKIKAANTGETREVGVLKDQLAAVVARESTESGPPGPAPVHQWNGTRLRFKNPDGTWGKWVDLEGPGGGVAVIGSSGGLDLSSLPAADDSVPDGFVVRQAGRWVRATYAQMRDWLGGGDIEMGVTVGGETVTVGGVPVTVSLH